jgi:MYXO-CTERM domain-containing protein
MTAFFRAIAALSLILWSSRASASPGYPAVFDSMLGLPCEPTCDVCHVNRTGFATANTLLGRSMRKAGLKCCDDENLQAIIDELSRSGHDSDGDGVADMDELIAGTDPNDEAAELACKVEENYDGMRVFGVSCAVQPGRASGETTFAAFVVLVSLLGATRRRRFKR